MQQGDVPLEMVMSNLKRKIILTYPPQKGRERAAKRPDTVDKQDDNRNDVTLAKQSKL